MKKLKLYLETSVWNFYFANDAPEKKEVTLQFFQKVENDEYDIYISQLVFDEIERASKEKRTLLIDLIKKFNPEELKITEKVLLLANKYITEFALPKRAIDDSTHVAVATVNEMDALISWNLNHLANLRRMEKVNEINFKEGYYKHLEMITPLEVSNDDENL